MLRTLMASNDQVRSPGLWLVRTVSAGAHAALVLGAVYATARPAPPRWEVAPDTTVFLLPPPRGPETTPDTPRLGRLGRSDLFPRFDRLPSTKDIPLDSPLPGWLSRQFDPGDYATFPRGGSPAPGDIWANPLRGGVIDVRLAQERPQRLSCPEPAYPAALRRAGIEGRTVLQFVIEADGRVRRGSLAVVSSDHPAFEAPARAAVLRCRFRPARAAGAVVPVLVTMPIGFQMKR